MRPLNAISVMLTSATLAVFGFTSSAGSANSVGSAAETAANAITTEPMSIPNNSRLITGTPVFEDGELKCRIKCPALGFKRAAAFRFLGYAPALGRRVATDWIEDGGEIFCHPLQTWDIGFGHFAGDLEPVDSCQVAVR